VKNIHVSNIVADKMSEGVLGIETDVLYQWRDLVSTYERRLTPISDIFLDNIRAKEVQFFSRIMGQKALPVQNVTLSNVAVDTTRGVKYINENVLNFLTD
jgi:hypothetical protein